MAVIQSNKISCLDNGCFKTFLVRTEAFIVAFRVVISLYTYILMDEK